jgi:ribokinase
MAADALGVGLATLDFVGVVERYPGLDAKVDLSAFSLQGGGPVATALCALARLGARTALCGRVADDPPGEAIRRGLGDAGVDVTALGVQPGRVSPCSFVAVDRASGRRTVFHSRGSVDPPGPADLDLSALDGARVLLVDGHWPRAQIAACERARERGVPVVLGAGSRREGMGELVALCDVLIAAERFAAELAPRGEIEDSLQELALLGPRTVVVTLGAQGSVGLDGERLIRTPALAVDVTDTTGAGDAYHGAFAYGLLSGGPVERCMRLASVVAGLKCRALGGRAGLPTLVEALTTAWPAELV